MGAFAEALDYLAAIPVSGVTSYAPGATPDDVTGAQLPALLILPELGGDSPGLEVSSFSAGDGQVTVQVTHVLLVAPVAQGMGMRSALPALAAAIDAYLAALAADPLLGGVLPVALRCRVRAGVVGYAGREYHGAVFTHLWQLAV